MDELTHAPHPAGDPGRRADGAPHLPAPRGFWQRIGDRLAELLKAPKFFPLSLGERVGVREAPAC